MVTKVPLAEAGCCVPLRFQVICYCVFVGMQPLFRCGKKNMAMHTNSLRIATRHQRRSGWRTHGRRYHEASKLSTFNCQPINVGRFDLFRTETTQIAVTLVVDENQYKIRLSGLGELCCYKTESKNEQERNAFGHV